jgi:hypothetical protein
MNSASVRWAEPPEEEPEVEAHDAAVDESFATRRLRRWLAGMFGGEPTPRDEPPTEDQHNS